MLPLLLFSSQAGTTLINISLGYEFPTHDWLIIRSSSRLWCGVSWDRVSESKTHSASTIFSRVIDLGRPYAFDRDFCSSRDVSQAQLFVVVGSECVRSASSMRIRQLVVLINKHLFVRWCVSERGAETHNWRARWCSAREVAGSARARPIWWAKLRSTNF